MKNKTLPLFAFSTGFLLMVGAMVASAQSSTNSNVGHSLLLNSTNAISSNSTNQNSQNSQNGQMSNSQY